MNKSFSIAPMLDLTDRHCRAFLRQLSTEFRLYTEMKVVESILHGDRERFLEFDPSEHPVALQLGGSNPEKLTFCATLAEQWGYDEVNLNVGCPSDRVKNAKFGACLMAEPQLVSDCIKSMLDSVSIPVTVKTRIGIDDLDQYSDLVEFVGKVRESGCENFIIHARKAWLKGLSPKENRTIPPLHYDRVYKLKEDYPELNIVINGGISTIDEIQKHLTFVDGVMMGREAYQKPWLIKEIDQHFFADTVPEIKTRIDAVNAYLPYVEQQLSKGIYLHHMTRHMLGLFHGQTGAKGWRRYLSEHGSKKTARIEVIQHALKFVQDNAEYSVRNRFSGDSQDHFVALG